MGFIIVIIVIVLLAMAFSVRIVTQYERGVVFRLGKVEGQIKEPGLRLIIPIIDQMRKVSLRIVTLPIESQKIITKDNVSIDVAAFLSVYRGLESTEQLPSFFDANSVPPLLVLPNSFANQMHGTTEGVEISLNWKVMDRWTLSPGYSFLEMHLHTDPTSLDTTSAADAQGQSRPTRGLP